MHVQFKISLQNTERNVFTMQLKPVLQTVHVTS